MASHTMDVDSCEEAFEVLCEEGMPCLKKRRRAEQELQARLGATPVEELGLDAEEAPTGAEPECCICLEPLRPTEAGEAPCGGAVRLACGHRFHGCRCLAPYVESSYQEVQRRVEAELKQRFDAMGLPREDRQNVLGGNFVEMLRQGQLRQCPRCRYGPVLNTHCGDLRAHDRERGQGTDRTTNQCPTCGFFSAHWADWAIWDPEDFAAATRCPLCRDCCKLAPEEVSRLQDRLAEVDSQLSRANWLHWFSPLDFSALLCFLQLEAGPDGPLPEGPAEELAGGASQELARSLLQRPLLELVRQRLALEERDARRALAERARGGGLPEDRQALALRLMLDFETAEGFQGAACAAELQALFPSAAPEALAEVREAQEASEEAMSTVLATLLAGEAAAGAQGQANGSTGAQEVDVLSAIQAVQELRPSEQRFQAAWARQDFLRAMHIAENAKQALEAALRPVVAASEGLQADLRPLRWEGEAFAVLPDLERLLRVLQSHAPWPHLPSCVANCVLLSGATASAAEAGAAPSREALNEGILSLARAALAPSGAPSPQPAAPGQACEGFLERQCCLELLLSTTREGMDEGLAKRLVQPLQRPAAARGPPAPCHHGRMLQEVLVRQADLQKAARDEGAEGLDAVNAADLLAAIHHMSIMVVRETVPLDRVGRQPEHLRGVMRDLQRRAFYLQGLVREQLIHGRERAAADGRGQAAGRAGELQGELQLLVREHLILLMHRILACGAALEA